MTTLVDKIVAGIATWTEVHMFAARKAETYARLAEHRRDNEHTCPKKACCWHDPAPFRVIRDEHVEKAIANVR